jgi:predicted RNA-binding Zn-ribbon protein involved in translation (DUF1610 family)
MDTEPPPVAPPPIPRCWKCGYELSGIRVDGKCPECGIDIWSRPPSSQTNGLAIASMVVGIVSLVTLMGCFPVGAVLGIVAVVFGHMGRKQSKSMSGAIGGGMAMAGLSMGWVSVGLSLAILALYAVLFATGNLA